MIIHSGVWREQVPVPAARSRVVTYDARGSGRSDRPREAAAYQLPELVADAVAVLDATGTDRAVLVGSSLGGAARRPGRRDPPLLDAQFVPLPGAGHIPAVTSAVEVTAVIQCVADASERSLT